MTVDVVLGGEVVWIATDVGLAFGLIDADVVDEHLSGELEVGPVDVSETQEMARFIRMYMGSCGTGLR